MDLNVISAVGSAVCAAGTIGGLMYFFMREPPFVKEAVLVRWHDTKNRPTWNLAFGVSTSLLNCRIVSVRLKGFKVANINSRMTDPTSFRKFSPIRELLLFHSESLRELFTSSPKELEKTLLFVAVPDAEKPPESTELIVRFKWRFFRWTRRVTLTVPTDMDCSGMFDDTLSEKQAEARISAGSGS